MTFGAMGVSCRGTAVTAEASNTRLQRMDRIVTLEVSRLGGNMIKRPYG